VRELIESEVEALIDRVGPSLGSDHTYPPIFPKGRRDVCVVHRLVEGGGNGFDVIYLVWREPDGSLNYKEIANSRGRGDYLVIKSVEAQEDGSISVELRSTSSNISWSESILLGSGGQQTQVVKKPARTFTEKANQAMLKVLEQHQHYHPLYKPTTVTECVIDEGRKIAAFILKEQIDTDRGSEDSEGWLGDQFRYSLWVVKDEGEPIQLYEDHAYIRPRTRSHLTGTRGRDCSIRNLKLEEHLIRVTHLKGDRVEEQEPEELMFEI